MFILTHSMITFYKQAHAFIIGQRNKHLILTICIPMIHISVKNPGCLFFFGLVFLWRRSAMHILFLNKAQYFISPFFFRFIISQCLQIKQKQKKILTFDLKFRSPNYTQIYETSPGSSKSDGLSILTLYEVFKFRCPRCTRYPQCPQSKQKQKKFRPFI